MLRHFDGAIALSRIAWQQISASCPVLANTTREVHYIEHFHSVTRRVSDGSLWPARPQALMVMEHRVLPTARPFCVNLSKALGPEVDFSCNPLWGGMAAPSSRLGFLSQALKMSGGEVQARMAAFLGTGDLFTRVFAQYDLLIQWFHSNAAQRLTNALATGVPVIALWTPTFEEARPAWTGLAEIS